MIGPEIQVVVQEGKKYCPHLPPVPMGDKINPNKFNMFLTECVGKHCAKFEQCQGAQSPAARDSLLAVLLRAIASVPFVPADIQGILTTRAAMLEASVSPAQTPGAPTA
jgi:hypothetical protein